MREGRDLSDERMIKIANAAEEVGVSVKTVYNWIEDGSLKLAHPGFVFLSDVRRVQLFKLNRRVELSKDMSDRFTRDDRGKFRLLSGGLDLGKSDG